MYMKRDAIKSLPCIKCYARQTQDVAAAALHECINVIERDKIA